MLATLLNSYALTVLDVPPGAVNLVAMCYMTGTNPQQQQGGAAGVDAPHRDLFAYAVGQMQLDEEQVMRGQGFRCIGWGLMCLRPCRVCGVVLLFCVYVCAGARVCAQAGQ